MKEITVPAQVLKILQTLEASGYEAYIVGGCVRDQLLGNWPQDWDIATSAIPEQTMECFKEFDIATDGKKHGTVTVISKKRPYEITTYRADGTYSDLRRPDSVSFVSSLAEDLKRRDFTINAMAFHPGKGLIDPFNGREDLENGIIRCVGDAEKRLLEDALRIMRALRFASTLCFRIDGETRGAMKKQKNLLKSISAERLSAELTKLLQGGWVHRILMAYWDIIAVFIPEIEPMVGFDQHNKYHMYDVWEHTLVCVENADDDLIRLVMFFHDIGKPKCFTKKDGIGHFYGHEAVGAKMTEKIMKRLRFSGKTTAAVCELIYYHDREIMPNPKHIKRMLNKIGPERFFQLMAVKRCDIKGRSLEYLETRLKTVNEVEGMAKEIIAQNQCFCIEDLALNGNDLLELGIPPGPEIGILLEGMIRAVIDEKVINEKEALLAWARRRKPGK